MVILNCVETFFSFAHSCAANAKKLIKSIHFKKFVQGLKEKAVAMLRGKVETATNSPNVESPQVFNNVAPVEKPRETKVSKKPSTKIYGPRNKPY